MLAIAVCVWLALASIIPQIDKDLSLGIAIAILFFLDVLYRIFMVSKKVEILKADVATGKIKPIRTDLIVVLPTPIGAAISGMGGTLMLFPAWLFAILLGVFFFVLNPR